eukprot:gnl/TRDRNA2_/TRDRNA2_125220_c1_seq2.p1 gnl/TRDRNA2_/TRDRNA2_125220_c1~~gnl/TRDRNA2_/TRDRNA2_125220_c1_seq2.p1  ORF type:complete len:175 (+),score=27.20 gnl/TRDRNA2_/TRDRNA2_125220_c1_seq2:60-584(+)
MLWQIAAMMLLADCVRGDQHGFCLMELSKFIDLPHCAPGAGYVTYVDTGMCTPGCRALTNKIVDLCEGKYDKWDKPFNGVPEYTSMNDDYSNLAAFCADPCQKALYTLSATPACSADGLTLDSQALCGAPAECQELLCTIVRECPEDGPAPFRGPANATREAQAKARWLLWKVV